MQVAVKVLRSELGDDPEFRVRFRREVALLTRVQGFCTVRVIEADTESASPYLVTEYADGPSLAEYVSTHGPLPADLLYGLATGLAEALTAIHAAGVVHRDLKPANVLLTQSGPKVIDFGIAQALDSTALTRTGMTVGSPGFMAPEQLAGQAGQAADIFSWGLTVAYAASGLPPFGTGQPEVIFYRVLNDRPDIAALPESMRPIIEASLAKTPDGRPSASAVLEHLVSLSGQPGDVANVPTQTLLARIWHLPFEARPNATPSAVPKTRSRPLLILSAAALVAIGGGTGAALLANGGSSHSQANGAGASAPTSLAAGRTTASASTVPASSATHPSATTSSVPVVSQPGASPFRSSGVADDASALDYVAGFGYGSPGLHYPTWDPSAKLNAVVAYYNGGAASGPGKVFFFANGQYVGSDTTDGSSSVGAVRVSSTVIEVQYLLYKPGAPACCPNGGTDDVEFSWTGAKLVALSQIPPASERS